MGEETRLAARLAVVFALAKDDGTLQIFASRDAAIAHAEAIDVRDGNWLFFDGSGQALRPVFEERGARTSFFARLFDGSEPYGLEVAGDRLPALLEVLPAVRAVEGPPELATVEAIRTHLQLQANR